MKVYGRILGTWGNGDVSSEAIDSTGHVVGWWVSSSPSWAKIDLPRSLPEGTEIEWVERDDPRLPSPCPGCENCANNQVGESGN